MESQKHDPQWANFECECGHVATVKLPDEPWQPRDELLSRAICTACGRRGAKDMRMTSEPAHA